MLINLNNAFKSGQKCIIAFNFYNSESLAAILNAAKETGKIIIVAFGESYIPHMPLEIAATMAKEYSSLYRIPFVLHFDHAKNIQNIRKAIDLGFSSVMYDGSYLPFEQNMRNTREVIEYARKSNVSVESELGAMNPEDGTPSGSSYWEKAYTNVRQASDFVMQTKTDALAVSVGNVHGLYHGEPHIDLERLTRIKKAADIPLVLHGSSGIPINTLKKAIGCGVRKINVNTELAIGAASSVKDYLGDHLGEKVRMEKLLECAQSEITKIAVCYLKAL